MATTTWTGRFQRRASDALRLRSADVAAHRVAIVFALGPEALSLPADAELSDASNAWLLFAGRVAGHPHSWSVPLAHVVSVELIPAPKEQ